MAPDALCIIVKVLSALCKQLFQRRKLQARTEDLHRLLQLCNGWQRRCDADVGVLRVDTVRERCARAGHHNARFLAERKRPLGKAGLGVD